MVLVWITFKKASIFLSFIYYWCLKLSIFDYHVDYTDECAPAEKIIKYEHVSKMFQRLGYRQHPPRKAYWYLGPSQLVHQNKDVVFPDVVFPRQYQNQKNPFLKVLYELIGAAGKSDNISLLIRYYFFSKPLW